MEVFNKQLTSRETKVKYTGIIVPAVTPLTEIYKLDDKA